MTNSLAVEAPKETGNHLEDPTNEYMWLIDLARDATSSGLEIDAKELKTRENSILRNVERLERDRKLLDEKEKTIECFKKSLEIDAQMGNILGKAISTSNIGELYFEIGKREEGYNYVMEGLETGLEIKAMDFVKHCYELLAREYAKDQKFDLAYAYHRKYSMTKDQIIDEVLKQRKVKPNTVYVNLQNSKYFKKDKSGKFSIA